MQSSANDTRLTVDQAASILGIGASSLRLLIRAKKIRFMRIGPNGGRYYLRHEWLDEYERSCEVAPAISEPAVTSARVAKPYRSDTQATHNTLNFKDQLAELKAKVRGRGVV